MTHVTPQLPDLAERNEAVKLWEAKQATHKALMDAKVPQEDSKPHQEFYEARAKLEETHRAAIRALALERDKKLGLTELAAAHEAAKKAYDDHPLEVLTEYNEDDDEERVERCALSGYPITASDDVFRHEDGKAILYNVARHVAPDSLPEIKGADDEGDDEDEDRKVA